MLLKPLGSLVESPLHPWRGPELSSSVPPAWETHRDEVMQYLAGGEVCLPWMGYSHDLLGDRFEVMGGHALVSDGDYYWRADAVAYLTHYPIDIPVDALRLFASRSWTPPRLSAAESRRLETALHELFKGNIEVIG